MPKMLDFDPAEYIKDQEDERYALMAAYEEDPGDGSLICSTLGDIARARDMTQLSKDTGLKRENLKKSF